MPDSRSELRFAPTCLLHGRGQVGDKCTCPDGTYPDIDRILAQANSHTDECECGACNDAANAATTAPEDAFKDNTHD